MVGTSNFIWAGIPSWVLRYIKGKIVYQKDPEAKPAPALRTF